jgi:hypothetical protein
VVFEMFFSRNHGPSRFIKEYEVFLRRANLDDADQLIALNKIFRYFLDVERDIFSYIFLANDNGM